EAVLRGSDDGDVECHGRRRACTAGQTAESGDGKASIRARCERGRTARSREPAGGSGVGDPARRNRVELVRAGGGRHGDREENGCSKRECETRETRFDHDGLLLKITIHVDYNLHVSGRLVAMDAQTSGRSEGARFVVRTGLARTIVDRGGNGKRSPAGVEPELTSRASLG